jgi:hypothetical protein
MHCTHNTVLTFAATGVDEGTMIGLVAAFAGSFFSCAAGIYIEKILKSASAASDAFGDIELSLRNIQVSGLPVQ